jgi:hypothetical protein
MSFLSGLNPFRGIQEIFGTGEKYRNPSDVAMGYTNQIPDILKKYYGPYAEAGQNALPSLSSEYSKLMSNPGELMSRLGAGYQQSPGFQTALKESLQGANQAAAAGGMAGTPLAQRYGADIAQQMSMRDFQDYLQQALGLYGSGLSGQQHMYDVGSGAAGNLADSLSQHLWGQGGLAFGGQNIRNQRSQGMFPDLLRMGINYGASGGFA